MTEHVLKYLSQAEDAETDPDYRDAYRISWITLSLAYQDHPLPFLQAFYTVFGIHPDKLMEKLKQRRLSQLERWYSTFWGELPTELWGVQKKLPQSTRKESVPERADSPTHKPALTSAAAVGTKSVRGAA